MKPHLKKIGKQVIVITGASSGIGLATARAAAKKGAKVVLAARSIETLTEEVDRITEAGGEALAVACDVARRGDLERVADEAVGRFGRIDTWVNNAGLGMWARLDETEESEARRLFDINFWGVVNGSVVALPHLRESGGALINVGSEASDASPPLLGMYAASKHAVKGYTDSLRVEIEEIDEAPVAITLIQPTAVDTPFPEHALNLTDKEATLPRPRLEPEDVAEAILEAAQTPTRDKTVGVMAAINTGVSKMMPGVADKMAAKQADKLQSDESPRTPKGTLHQSSEQAGSAGRTHGTTTEEAH